MVGVTVAMMLHGVSPAGAQDLCGKYRGDLGLCRSRCVPRRRDGGIGGGDGLGAVPHFGGFRLRSDRVDSLPSCGFFRLSSGGVNPITVRSFGGRRHNRRREPPGGLVGVRKQRGDDKVEITLDFDELKQKAGEAAVTTKRALVSSVGKARQV